MVFYALIHVSASDLQENNDITDQTPPHKVASDLDVHCVPMSPKWNTRLIWVKLASFQNTSLDGTNVVKLLIM